MVKIFSNDFFLVLLYADDTLILDENELQGKSIFYNARYLST